MASSPPNRTTDADGPRSLIEIVWLGGLLCIGNLGFMLSEGLSGTHIAQLADDFFFTTLAVGLVLAINPLTNILVSVPAGVASDSTWFLGGRRRPYLLIGSLVACGALVMIPASPSALVFVLMVLPFPRQLFRAGVQLGVSISQLPLCPPPLVFQLLAELFNRPGKLLLLCASGRFNFPRFRRALPKLLQLHFTLPQAIAELVLLITIAGRLMFQVRK